MALTGVDVRVLVHEIKEVVDKSWIVNIYELPNKIFIFKLREPGEGLKFLLIEPGKRFHLTTFNREMPPKPSVYAKELRSHLRDNMINYIEQKGIDRIIKLSIGPEPSYTLVIELFGEGNMILVSPEGKIVSAIKYKKMKDRDIHPGKEFKEMPSLEYDIFKIDIDHIPILLKEKENLFSAINQILGLGPQYTKYILNLTGIEKDKTSELSENEVSDIQKKVKQLRERLINHEYDPVVYLEPDQEKDERSELDYDDQWGDDRLPFKPENVIKIQPWPQMKDDEDIEVMKIDNLWRAIDVFYSAQETQEIVEDRSEELEEHVQTLENQLEEQEKHKKRLERMGKIYRNYADALYANFQAADELISTVYNAKKNNMDWDTIEQKLAKGKEKGIKSAKLFDKINPEKAKMHLDLPFNGDSYSVAVDFTKSLTDNANEYYEKAKKSEAKAEGATRAIENTKQKIEQAEQDVQEKLEKARDQVVILKRRKAWYEKFHWTKTPNGRLIIGGYDASSNEKLVKRYLEPQDKFAHADLSGASAVVIKSEGKNITAQDKRIAAQLAVSYSSGWKAKLPMADAFIVEPDQVSLTPPSGEYLPKGSFMIYGEKEFEKNCSLELCIGMILEKHWAKIFVGTEECMNNVHMWAKIVPGGKTRGEIGKQIIHEFKEMTNKVGKQKIDAIDPSEVAWYVPNNSKITELQNNL